MSKTKLFLSFVVLLLTFSVLEVDTADASSFDINRIYGEDRYDTAVEISQTNFSKGANTIVLAVGNNFPDALAGAPLAHKLNAPILLTGKNSLNASTLKEIKRLGASTAVILGGTGTISSAVEKQLTDLGIDIDRIQGNNRYETSAKIAERIGGSKAVVVSGSNFADSLAIASYAAKNQYPILLTSKDKIDPTVKKVVSKYSNTYVVGGTAAVSDGVLKQLNKAQRIAGKDRYETAAKVAEKLYPASLPTTTVATGQGFADALTGSTYAAKQNQPVILVRQDSVPAPVREVLKDKGVSNVTVIGGQQVVKDTAFDPPKPPAPKPKPEPVKSDIPSEVVETAKKYIGTPYKWGGTTPSGFDCSGFLNYVYKAHDVSIPRTTAEIWNYGIKVSSPKVGDVVMFETYKKGPSHAGIYIGSNQFIHSGNNGVEISSLSNSYWSNAYLGSVDIINK